MSLGWIVFALIVIFMIGNFMGGRVDHKTMRKEVLRKYSKDLELAPNECALPNFLVQTLPEPLPKTVTSYHVVDDLWRLPLGQFVYDGQWRSVDNQDTRAKILNRLPISDELQQAMLGIRVQANGVELFWQEQRFTGEIEELSTLKNWLLKLGETLATDRRL